MLTPIETMALLHKQTEGGVYMDERNLTSAFVIYMKFVSLALEKLPKHPGYSRLTPEETKLLKKRAKNALGVAEGLKKKLLEQLEKEYAKYETERTVSDQLSEQVAKDLQLEENEVEERRQAEEKEDFERRIAQIKEAERKRALSEANQVPEPQRHGKDSSFNNKSTTNNSNNSSSLFNSISSNASSAANLRPLFVPAILREKFASLSERNTERNIETCGVLCGKMSNNQFTVTVVVLPKQSGTSDSCLTSHEEELFEVLEKHDVITLGWIHTHPSQSAFLSSVDLHTHFSYQSMLPESIAIVYAPRYQQYQSFSITPPGLSVLGECKQTGFHYHAKEPPLEMVSPHVQMDPSLGLTTVDLRL
ncbi:STAM-binding protein-like A isoform X2 [Convolutriloba macropyga]|uniref:STAM-binding protein-like A isoform X2 n=1 Tax=Convolutriloba macropyga TaxID=536237 RepID=UPI003F51D89E